MVAIASTWMPAQSMIGKGAVALSKIAFKSVPPKSTAQAVLLGGTDLNALVKDGAQAVHLNQCHPKALLELHL